VALAKKTKQRKKKDSGKLAIRQDHPRRRIEVKVCVPTADCRVASGV